MEVRKTALGMHSWAYPRVVSPLFMKCRGRGGGGGGSGVKDSPSPGSMVVGRGGSEGSCLFWEKLVTG